MSLSWACGPSTDAGSGASAGPPPAVETGRADSEDARAPEHPESGGGLVDSLPDGLTPELAPASAPSIEPPVPAALAMVRGLPTIERAPVSRAAAKSADAAHEEGLALHASGDLEGARARYRDALTHDPGHLGARYDVGRALSRGGELEAALEVLAQLRSAGCPECQERVLATRTDDDWAPARERARYRELIEAVAAELHTVERAAALVQTWVEDPVANAAPSLLSPRHAVSAKILCTTCDPEDAGPGGDDIRDWLRGAEAVTRWYRDVHRQAREHRGVVIGETLRCRNGCCRFKREDAEKDEDGEERLRRNTLYFERVCFKTVDERALWITRLSFLDGG